MSATNDESAGSIDTRGVLNDEDEVHFVSVPPLGEGRIHGTICSIRTEIVELSQLPCLSLLMPEEVIDALDIKSVPPLPAFVIERTIRGSAATVQHVYCKSDVSLKLLEEMENPSGVMEEDLHILKFASNIAMSSSAGGGDAASMNGTGARAAQHKRLRPLQAENAVLRASIGLTRTQKVDAATTHTAVHALQETYHQEQLKKAADAKALAGGSPAKQQRGADGDEEAGVVASGPDHQDLHSPLQWEMETEAAVNARTRYDPNRQKSASGKRTQLDVITQQQLVARLHDKSVDSRDKRKAENQDRIERELGNKERKILTCEEQQNLGVRLHDTQREYTKKLLIDAELKAHGPPPEKKKFSSDEQAASNDRIYREPKDKTKHVMEKLYNHYIVEEEAKIPKVKLRLDQQKAMGDRLAQRHRD